MVDNATREASAKASQERAKTETTKAKEIQTNISASQTGANRGYDYSSTSDGITVGADKGKLYTIDSQGQKVYAKDLEQQKQNNEINQKYLEQQRQINYQNELAKQNEIANAKLRPELVGAKTDMYANRGYHYEDSSDENVIHGADPSKRTNDNPTGFYASNKNTGEKYTVTPEDAKSVGQYQPDLSKTPLNDVKTGSNPLDDTTVNKSKLVKVENNSYTGFSTDQQNQLIENKNKIIESNNLLIQKENRKNIDAWVEEGKKIGYKEVKITDKGVTQKISIDKSSDILSNVSPSATIKFVQTPEMKKAKENELSSRRDFGKYAISSGASEIKTTTNGITTHYPVKDYNSAFKNATIDTKFGLVVNDTIRKKNESNLENKRAFIDESFGASGREARLKKIILMKNQFYFVLVNNEK